MTTDHATLVNGSPPAGGDLAEPAATPVCDARLGHWLAAVGYAVLAFGVTGYLWLHPTSVMLRENRQDQIQFEWMLTNAARTLRQLSDPFFTDMINMPFGVNLMANTSTWGLALPLAPMTMLLGAPVAFRIMLTAAFFGTALAWYHVLSRCAVRSRLAAFVGGGFCAFAPGMLGQGTGHPNIVAQFVLPFIVLVVLRMRDGGHPVRSGLLLAGLVAYQIFINEEILFLTALALGVFVLAYAVQRPQVIKPVLRRSLLSLAVTAVVVSIVVAYPLYRQFFGAQSYRGLPDWVLAYSTDLASYVAYAQQSLGGTKAGAAPLAQGVSEQNTFYGWGLLALVVIVVAMLWRRAVVRALAVTGVVFLLLSLGLQPVIHGNKTHIPGPWRLLTNLPLFDTVVPTRLSLIVIPVVGALLAFFVEWLMTEGGPAVASADGRPLVDLVAGRLRTGFAGRRDAVAKARRFWTPVRVLGFGALVVALLPIAPTPLVVSARHPAPRFFATGAWRQQVPEGATVGILPFSWLGDLDAMQWQTEQELRFKIVGGYFLGPDPARDDKRAGFGPGGYYLRSVFSDSREPGTSLTDTERESCLAQLRSWHTDVLVLPESAPNAAALREGAEQILGAGQHVEDVWIWRVAGA
jgi:hypothetical protein